MAVTFVEEVMEALYGHPMVVILTQLVAMQVPVLYCQATIKTTGRVVKMRGNIQEYCVALREDKLTQLKIDTSLMTVMIKKGVSFKKI